MARRKRHRRQQKPPTPEEWKKAFLVWLDTLDDSELPGGFTRDEIRQTVDEVARTARPDGQGGWTVEGPW